MIEETRLLNFQEKNFRTSTLANTRQIPYIKKLIESSVMPKTYQIHAYLDIRVLI